MCMLGQCGPDVLGGTPGIWREGSETAEAFETVLDPEMAWHDAETRR